MKETYSEKTTRHCKIIYSRFHSEILIINDQRKFLDQKGSSRASLAFLTTVIN